MGRLYQRHKDGNWYGDYQTADGKRKQHSLRTRNREVARARLKSAEMGQTTHSGAKKQKLMDAIDGMIASMHKQAEPTKRMYREKARRVLKTIGNPNVSDVTFAMLNSYVVKRQGEKAADHSIQKELITIRRALKFAVNNRTLTTLPNWPEFSANYEPRTTWLTAPQFDAMVAKLPAARRLWAKLAALGGMRSGEVERLTWDMVELDKNRIRVPGTKTVKSKRAVPIAPALRAELEQAALDQPGHRSAVVAPWGNVRRDLHVACDAAAVPRVSPNDLRRTFASWMVQAGAPLLTVAALMGHSSTRMLEKVYAQLDDASLESAINRLPVTDGVTPKVPNMANPEETRHEPDDPE